jgi:hypothetical protein
LRPAFENLATLICPSTAATANIDFELAGIETGCGICGLLLSFPAAAIMRQLFSNALCPIVSKEPKADH